MKIIADENIARVAEYFAWAGELLTLPGRAIDAATVRDADALLVRSITRVDASLLNGSRCRFVGTATSGIDHVDTAWLQQRGIGLGWARGCNANSVVEYVFSALASLSMQQGFDWRTRSVGIAGCGEIGSQLARKLLGLNMNVRIFDPFLASGHPLAPHFVSLDEMLRQDILSFHTPLTHDGEWPSWHLLDAARLAQLAPSAILINAARGSVVDNKALLAHLQHNPDQCVVLDAWEGEPEISQALLRQVAIATPHIAGYSREGKLQGTQMIAADFQAFFGLRPPPEQRVNKDKLKPLRSDPQQSSLAQINSLVCRAYDVMADHRQLQTLLTAENPAAQFDLLRKNYPLRSGFSDYCVDAAGLKAGIAAQARMLGFEVQLLDCYCR